MWIVISKLEAFEFNIFISFQKVFDLLNPKGVKEGNYLEIRENKNGEVKIPGF